MSNERTPDKTFTKKEIASIARRDNVSGFENYNPQWLTMSDIKAKPQPWFWQGMIPSSTLTLFGGHGGIGKSLILLYLAAKTTSGENFNAGGLTHTLEKGAVILLSAEDDIEQQIKPKLIAANANCKKIHFLVSKIGDISGKQKFIELNKDLHLLENKIQELQDVKLIIVDPITYFIGDLRENYNSDVANFLQSLIILAKKYNISILLNKHLRKQATGAKGAALAADEVGGAGAWTNTPRRCWLITNHPDDLEIKVITKMKDNLGAKDKECLAYKIIPVEIEEDGVVIKTTILTWLDEMQSLTSEEAVNEEKYEKSKLQYAVEFILSYLKENGQSVVAHIKEKSVKKGVKEQTFRRAMGEIEQGHKESVRVTSGVRGAKIYNLID